MKKITNSRKVRNMFFFLFDWLCRAFPWEKHFRLNKSFRWILRSQLLCMPHLIAHLKILSVNSIHHQFILNYIYLFIYSKCRPIFCTEPGWAVCLILILFYQMFHLFKFIISFNTLWGIILKVCLKKVVCLSVGDKK